MAITVEMYGVPGAGKTYLADSLKQRLRDEGMSVASFEGWSRRWKWRAIVHYRHAVVLLALGFVRGPRDVRDLPQVMRFVVTTLERHFLAKHDTSDTVYVLDEGVVQRLFMLFVDQSSAEIPVSGRLLRRLPVADVFVHVSEEAGIVADRLRLRERGLPDRFVSMEQTMWSTLASDADVAMQSIVDRLASESGTRGARPVLMRCKSADCDEVFVAITGRWSETSVD